jgi:hypothetical protein
MSLSYYINTRPDGGIDVTVAEFSYGTGDLTFDYELFNSEPSGNFTSNGNNNIITISKDDLNTYSYIYIVTIYRKGTKDALVIDTNGVYIADYRAYEEPETPGEPETPSSIYTLYFYIGDTIVETVTLTNDDPTFTLGYSYDKLFGKQLLNGRYVGVIDYIDSVSGVIYQSEDTIYCDGTVSEMHIYMNNYYDYYKLDFKVPYGWSLSDVWMDVWKDYIVGNTLWLPQPYVENVGGFILPQVHPWSVGWEYSLFENRELKQTGTSYELFPMFSHYYVPTTDGIYYPDNTIEITSDTEIQIVTTPLYTFRNINENYDGISVDDGLQLEGIYFDSTLSNRVPDSCQFLHQLYDYDAYNGHLYLNFKSADSNIKVYFDNQWVDCSTYVYQNGSFVECEIGATY